MAINVIILMAIGDYSIVNHWWILVAVILMAINVIILMAIGDYSIVNHWWLLMVINVIGYW